MRLLLIIMLWAAGLGAAGQFTKFSIIFDRLGAYAPDNPVLIGYLYSIISLVGLIFGLTAGIVLPRLGLRWMLFVALVVGGAISLLQAGFPSLGAMFVLRVIEGASHLVIVVAAPTLIAQSADDRMRPLAMALWSTFFGVAFAVTYFLGVPLVARLGYAAILLAHATYMLVVAAILILILPREAVSPPPASAPLFRLHFEAFTRAPSAIPALGWLCYTLTYVSFISLLSTIIGDKAARFTVIAPLIGIVSALGLGGLLFTRLSAIKVVLIGFGSGLILAIALLIAPNNVIVFSLILLALGLVQSGNFAVVPELNRDPAARSQALGAMAMMGNFGNVLGTPILLALLGVSPMRGLAVFLIVAYAGGVGIYAFGLGRARRAKG